MIILVTILLIVVGIILLVKGQNEWDNILFAHGLTITIIGGMGLLISIIFLFFKPIDYKTFKVEYETLKETVTSKDDLRDATITTKIIEINEQINSCREWKDNIWIGIFQNQKICNTELLKKEEVK